MPKYLTSEEAAEFLRTPLATLYKWRHEGTGPRARKVGKRLLYEQTELIDWVDSQAA